MRPTTGANLNNHTPIRWGSWKHEPKYDGWRAVVHVPTKRMWNRFGEPLSIVKDFQEALAKMPPEWKWLDCEGLQRRHEMARGTLIVLDTLDLPKDPYTVRKEKLAKSFEILEIGVDAQENSVYSSPSRDNDTELWNEVKDNPFYEGIVSKKANSIYKTGNTPTSKSPDWVKHRYDQ